MHFHNPKTTHYEFFGPVGAAFISTAVPITIYGLYFNCSEISDGCSPSLSSFPSSFINAMSSVGWINLFDLKATLAYFAWYASLVGLWYFLPGEWIEGTELRTGGRVKYKFNGFSTLLLNLGVAAGWILYFGPRSFTFIYDHWVGLCTATLLNSFIQVSYCYFMSTQNENSRLLSVGGNSGNLVHDWFIGRELNPSIGTFDIKSFNDLRPGLILWFLCNISSACKQVVYRDTWYPTDSMTLVLVFQSCYTIDSLYNEQYSPRSMDITTDGFGFMLSVGNIAWVPMTYSLQARYLAFNHVELGPFWTSLIFSVHALGYWIFRDSNNQKHNFRNGKNPSSTYLFIHLLQTPHQESDLISFQTERSRGTRLLTGGWWGICQHPNYLQVGDWIMSVSYSLPTGLGAPMTYFHCSYFLILLVHRQKRDEACRNKYGKDWDTYTRIVSWKIFPGVY
ncbi:C-14 sterol reductase ERG24 [Ceratobasidium theobromae]|uniref:C-14 sterol reductase ERG24 n=1 Tax=Ceratobasidium theobromae TaxID=1582974 RepID=A0A5N5QCS3_9AGAM|nr:C-14 sterol reductase ERG24 [Ceratobasidium theobromae]